ncbi:MAG: GNAT family N-acetyltransferase [Pyrinomonadaceae bacterium]|nr:GNAT family N-acetyltransferase [Pyrinomonadaceae bacterium]
MAEEIRRANAITDYERERLFNWGENIFGVTSYTLTWRRKDVHFFLYVDDEPISHVGLLKHEVSGGGRPLMVAGLGGVVTRPEAQGLGYARKLMERAAEFFAQEWKTEAGLLFCLERMMPYYEVLGWQTVGAPVLIEQPSGRIQSPLPVMVLPCNGRTWPAGEVNLQSLPW